MKNSIIKSVCVCVCFCLEPRWLRPAARRCAPLNQTWGPMISALWVHSHGTLNCQTLTATGSPSILVLVSANPKQRTTRNLLRQSRSSHLLPKELTCTRELSSLSPSSSLMWFTGLYICDYLQMILYYWPPPHTVTSFLIIKVNLKKCETTHTKWFLRIIIYYYNCYIYLKKHTHIVIICV